jgi:hypothetical protein
MHQADRRAEEQRAGIDPSRLEHFPRNVDGAVDKSATHAGRRPINRSDTHLRPF